MRDIVEMLGGLADVRILHPASEEQVTEAERALNVVFADDYISYVKAYGAVFARGIELTGITAHERLSVVCVTNKERALNQWLPSNMYVISSVPEDDIVIMQDETGKMYAVSPRGDFCMICQSLADYVANAAF